VPSDLTQQQQQHHQQQQRTGANHDTVRCGSLPCRPQQRRRRVPTATTAEATDTRQACLRTP
jgi:hypothetical protein